MGEVVLHDLPSLLHAGPRTWTSSLRREAVMGFLGQFSRLSFLVSSESECANQIPERHFRLSSALANG